MLRAKLWRASSLLLLLLFVTGGQRSFAAERCQTIRLARIAPGVYVAPPTGRDGFNAAMGVIVGGREAVVFDTGPGAHVAGPLQCTLRQRFAANVVRVYLSHSHPENVLGAGAFGAVRDGVVAHPTTARLMRERCPACRARFVEQFRLNVAPDAELQLPDRLQSDENAWLWQGRSLRWLPLATGHLPGNGAVFDPASRTLFAGGLVVNREIPDMTDADVDGWLAALDSLAAQRPTHVVPDRGSAGGAELIGETASYLRALLAGVKAAIDAGADLAEAPALMRLDQFRGWRGYPLAHDANVRREYLRQEQRWLSEPENR